MARTKDMQSAVAASALVERPQTWQAFATCCGRLVLWEQTDTGRQRVSPVGLPHVCTTQEPEQPTPAPGAIPATGVAALLREPESDSLRTASIPQRGEGTSPETTNALPASQA